MAAMTAMEAAKSDTRTKGTAKLGKGIKVKRIPADKGNAK